MDSLVLVVLQLPSLQQENPTTKFVVELLAIHPYIYGGFSIFVNIITVCCSLLITHGLERSRQHVWSFVTADYYEACYTDINYPCCNNESNWSHSIQVLWDRNISVILGDLNLVKV